MKTRVALIAGLVAIALIAAIAFLAGRGPPPAASAGKTTPSQAAPPPPPATTSTKQDAPAPRVVDRSSFDPLITDNYLSLDFRARAELLLARSQAGDAAGDTRSRIMLSSLLHECAPNALRKRERADKRIRRDLEEDKLAAQLGNQDDSREGRMRNEQRQLDDSITQRDICKHLPKALVDDWLAPLERAAQAGDTTAMREYALRAMAYYDSAEAIAADLDNAIAWRDKSRSYLAEALRRGDGKALVDLAEAYDEGTNLDRILYAPDPAKAYAYAYAGLMQSGLNAYERDALESTIARSAQRLDAQAIAQAREEGTRIYERCCGTH